MQNNSKMNIQLYIQLLANITDILMCLKACYIWFGSLGGCKQCMLYFKGQCLCFVLYVYYTFVCS